MALQSAAIGLGLGAVNKMLAPDLPELKGPSAMPDPLEMQKAQERSIIEQMARRGRQSTIMTNPGGAQTLGG
jgi:hypothetical protein